MTGEDVDINGDEWAVCEGCGEVVPVDAVEDPDRHITFSPAPETRLDRAFSAIRDALDAAGLEGTVFYHPFAGDDRGLWKSRLFGDGDGEGELVYQADPEDVAEEVDAIDADALLEELEGER